jgi:transcriptional regulator with XRE-family HTH domain
LNTQQRWQSLAMKVRDLLALNMRRLRRSKELSQEELAHRAELDRTYISALERSVYAASVDVLEKLAAALAVPPAELLAPPPRQRTKSGTKP